MLGAVRTGQTPRRAGCLGYGLAPFPTTPLCLQHVGQPLRAGIPLESVQMYPRIFYLNAGKDSFNTWAEIKRNLNPMLIGCVSLGQTPKLAEFPSSQRVILKITKLEDIHFSLPSHFTLDLVCPLPHLHPVLYPSVPLGLRHSKIPKTSVTIILYCAPTMC